MSRTVFAALSLACVLPVALVAPSLAPAAGHSVRTDSPFPVVVSISGGSGFTCAVTADARVLCWGQNVYGQLGSSGQTTAVPRQVTGLTAVTALSVRGHSACAVNAGEVWCWGAGGRGQLGSGSNGMSSLPVRVADISTARDVSVSGQHACAILIDASVQCWGAGTSGQLGDGMGHDSPLPVRVTGGIRAIALGDKYSCAATVQGFVRCWGDPGAGGAASLVPTRVVVPGASVAVTAGGTTTCSRIGTGAVWCWGGNWWGQAGSGAEASPVVPEHVMGLMHASRVVTGLKFTCATRSDRAGVWCWGSNTSGQISDDRFDSAGVPHEIAGGADAVVVGVGDDHLCMALSSGSVRCRGAGYGREWVSVDGFAPYVDPPLPEEIVPMVTGDSSSINVVWAGARPAYSVDISSNNGLTWTREVIAPVDGQVHWSRSGLAPATSLRLRLDCDGCSTADVVVATTGDAPQVVKVIGPDGQPLRGARVHVRDAQAVRTDARGFATLPATAAGLQAIRLEPVALPGGLTVSGTWTALMGSGPRALRVPAAPRAIRTSLRAVHPDGSPAVAAAVVTEGLRDRAVVSGFTFRIAPSATTTDSTGTAQVRGFPRLNAPARGRPARVLLLGDSHAAGFEQPLTRLAIEQGWQFREIWSAGCPWAPIPTVRADVDVIGDCELKLRTPARALVEQWQPDLVVLMGRSVMVRAVASPSGQIAPGSTGWRDIVESAASSAVAQLRSSGAQVVLVDPLPELAWDPYACLSESATPAGCSAARWYPDAADSWRAVQRDLARDVGVATVDLTGLICPELQCPMALGGIATRRDTQHLTRDYLDSVRSQLGDAFLSAGVDLRNGRITTPMAVVTDASGTARADIVDGTATITLSGPQTH